MENLLFFANSRGAFWTYCLNFLCICIIKWEGGKIQPWLGSPTDECNFSVCEEEYFHYAWVYFGFLEISFLIPCSQKGTHK